MAEINLDAKVEDPRAAQARAELESSPKTVAHITRGERAARGREARAETPRASHASFDTFLPRDPVELLERKAWKHRGLSERARTGANIARTCHAEGRGFEPHRQL